MFQLPYEPIIHPLDYDQSIINIETYLQALIRINNTINNLISNCPEMRETTTYYNQYFDIRTKYVHDEMNDIMLYQMEVHEKMTTWQTKLKFYKNFFESSETIKVINMHVM